MSIIPRYFDVIAYLLDEMGFINHFIDERPYDPHDGLDGGQPRRRMEVGVEDDKGQTREDHEQGAQPCLPGEGQDQCHPAGKLLGFGHLRTKKISTIGTYSNTFFAWVSSEENDRTVRYSCLLKLEKW